MDLGYVDQVEDCEGGKLVVEWPGEITLLTGVGILEAGLAGVEGGIDDTTEVVIEWLGAG